MKLNISIEVDDDSKEWVASIIDGIAVKVRTQDFENFATAEETDFSNRLKAADNIFFDGKYIGCYSVKGK